jgi:hypothetical protein
MKTRDLVTYSVASTARVGREAVSLLHFTSATLHLHICCHGNFVTSNVFEFYNRVRRHIFNLCALRVVMFENQLETFLYSLTCFLLLFFFFFFLLRHELMSISRVVSGTK